MTRAAFRHTMNHRDLLGLLDLNEIAAKVYHVLLTLITLTGCKKELMSPLEGKLFRKLLCNFI